MLSDNDEELTTAATPAGTGYLAGHLLSLYDDSAPFRADDYFTGMAVSILVSPKDHMDALVNAGVLVGTKKGYRLV